MENRSVRGPPGSDRIDPLVSSWGEGKGKKTDKAWLIAEEMEKNYTYGNPHGGTSIGTWTKGEIVVQVVIKKTIPVENTNLRMGSHGDSEQEHRYRDKKGRRAGTTLWNNRAKRQIITERRAGFVAERSLGGGRDRKRAASLQSGASSAKMGGGWRSGLVVLLGGERGGAPGTSSFLEEQEKGPKRSLAGYNCIQQRGAW